jgi:hypothetical protein
VPRRALVLVLSCAVALAACGSDEGSAEELCDAVRGEAGRLDVFEGFDPTDTETALDQLRSARVVLGDLRDAAPAEVRDDLSIEIDYVQALVEGLEGVDGQDAEATVAVVQQIADEHPDVAAAQAELTAFAEESCG